VCGSSGETSASKHQGPGTLVPDSTREYGCTYTNRDRLGVFAEKYGDDGRINPEEGDERALWRVFSVETLPMTALDEMEIQKSFGLDARIEEAKLRPRLGVAVPSRTGRSDLPSTYSGGCTPAHAAMVGARSMFATSSVLTTPCRTPGPRTRKGTPWVSS
jgi:hypothetical protein